MIKEAYQALRRPRLTEKAIILREKHPGLYVFEVHPALNKIEIRAVVEKLFSVKVDSVRTLHVEGKWKRVGRSYGQRADWKKAYVQLKTGEKTLESFEGA